MRENAPMKKILVTLNEPMTEALDNYCKEFCYSRSEVIRTLLRERFLKSTGGRKYTDKLNGELEQKEREVIAVKQKTDKISKTPIGADKLGGKSPYDVCPKHNSMYFTCGCVPK